MTRHLRLPSRFRYDGFELDPSRGAVHCHYELGEYRFTETVHFGTRGDWGQPAVEAAARLVFLLAGVSYYKTAAPEVVDLGAQAITEAEEALLTSFYRDGLGEFAFRNGLDLSSLRVDGPRRAVERSRPAPSAGDYRPRPGRALVPFGGGIDSIVTVERMRRAVAEPRLFVVGGPAGPFAAIEAPVAVSGLPVVRATRQIDPQVLRSDNGFLNGHVPVTGIISAIAVMAAVLEHAESVVMSNEWSASIGTEVAPGRMINHQYSKSLEFEQLLRTVVADALGPSMSYFSLLRPYSELWVAQQFGRLPEYHHAFRSCNRAFHADPAKRLDTWCGRCDKCCFIDLVLSPFLPAAELSEIFGEREPLGDPTLAEQFRALLGTSGAAKPFECVGEQSECRAALFMALERPDRGATPLLGLLAGEVRADGAPVPDPRPLLMPLGPHCLPDALAPDAPLV